MYVIVFILLVYKITGFINDKTLNFPEPEERISLINLKALSTPERQTFI
jgi:hypothetical protein